VASEIARLHAEVHLDLLEFPEWGCEGYVHLLNQTEWNRIPTIIHLHGPIVMFAHAIGWPGEESELYRIGTHMEGACLRLADAIFSSSRCSADWCARFYGLNAHEIPVIHTGVDTELFKPPNRRPREGGPVVVFAGKLVRNKGVDVLVAAACRVAGEFPGLHLRLLGRDEGALSRELIDMVDQSGLGGLLELPGCVPREQLPAEFARADVFVAPSVYEGGPGFVYLEAMACGLPVIGCDGSGVCEAIAPGTGLLIPPDDVEALADALRRLLGDAALREQMGRRGRAHVLAESDSRQCLARIEAFYESVVNGAPRRNT
jgi:glycosyltransferase involved in cell wall biosynthesis